MKRASRNRCAPVRAPALAEAYNVTFGYTILNVVQIPGEHRDRWNEVLDVLEGVDRRLRNHGESPLLPVRESLN